MTTRPPPEQPGGSGDATDPITLPPAVRAALAALREDRPAMDGPEQGLVEDRQDRQNSRDRNDRVWAAIEARLVPLNDVGEAGRAAEALDDAAAVTIDVAADPAMLAGLRALRTDEPPMHDLWPQVQARIRQRRLKRLRAPWLAAASMVGSVVVVLALFVDRDGAAPVAREPLRASAEVLAATRAGDGSPELLRMALRAGPPEARALMRANLTIVDSAEAQIRNAMDLDADDREYLESLLVATRHQQFALRAALDSSSNRASEWAGEGAGERMSAEPPSRAPFPNKPP